MKTLFATAIVAFGIACVAAPPALFAQQKTAKECREEWRANKDANKKAGVSEKDYVAKCRGEAAAATPAAAPSAAAPAGQAKTAKECRAEWRANKDANKKAGVSEKDYVAKCRGGTAAAAPAAQPPAAAPAPSAAAPATGAPQPTPSAAAPAAPAPAPAAAPKQAPSAAATPSGANQFASEAQAKGHCPTDTVVWVNLDSKIYHFSGYRNYGTTKEGAYMCEKDAVSQSFAAAKNEKHP